MNYLAHTVKLGGTWEQGYVQCAVRLSMSSLVFTVPMEAVPTSKGLRDLDWALLLCQLTALHHTRC